MRNSIPTKAYKIFYSWQSDREKKCCKDFIRIAADIAAAKVSTRLGVPISVDSDTEGVAGTPPINETILRKIDECDIFLADMTFVASSTAGKMLPNPNVMGEYGYALKSKGLTRILLAMNTAFGPAENLPFDLHHLRHPASYTLEEGSPDAQRRKARTDFSVVLERNISVAIEELLKVPDPSSSADRWGEAEEAMSNFLNSRIAAPSPVLVKDPKLVVCVVPLAALDHPRISAAMVKAARSQFPPSIDARVQDGQDENQWWSSDPLRHIPNSPNPEATWSIRLVRPGLFEVATTIGQRIGDDPEIVILGKDIEWHLVNAVDRVATVAHQIGLQGSALIGASLEGIEDVEIHRARPGAGGRRIRRRSASLGASRIQSLAAPTADTLVDLMEQMWLIGGWDDGSPFFLDGHWTGYDPTHT